MDALDEVGGRAGSFAEAGFRWDTGPSWYLMPEAFDHFFALCGTSTEAELDLVDLSPAYRVFHGDAPVDVRSGIEEVTALFESLEPSAGEKVHAYLAQASDTYEMALKHFLYTTFSAPLNLVHRDIRTRISRLMALLTVNLKQYVGRTFSDARLRQILSYPAVFLSSEPAAAPALYSLMSHTDLVEGVCYPQGGFAAVVQAIYRQARKFGATFRLGEEVTSIKIANRQVTGVRTNKGAIHADIVVSAADLHHTETQLLPPQLRTYPERYWGRRNPGLGTVLILAGVKGELPELAHHTLLFSQDWDPDFRAVYSGPEPSRPLGASESIYVSKTSATDPNVAPAGHENLFILVPDLVDRVVVKRTLGPADFAERYHAWSAGSIGPAHTLRQSAFLRGRNASRKVDGLDYAGATTVPGVGVPMCLISAENIIKRLRSDTSAAPLPTGAD